jgi:hypothetical protein
MNTPTSPLGEFLMQRKKMNQAKKTSPDAFGIKLVQC